MDIDKILLQVLNDKASKEEYEALEAWKKESADNIELLQQLSQKGSPETKPYKQYDKHKAWKLVEAQMDSSPQPIKKSKKSSNVLWYLLGIISILAIIGYFVLNNEKTPTVYKADNALLAFELQDKSNIWLRDGGSSLELKSDFESERRVALQGEGFFDISPDKERPFVIELNDNDFIKVLGTSFNVVNQQDKFEIAIYSGTVEFHTLNRVITLQKGDQVSKVMGSITKHKMTQNNQLSWKNKELVFENSDFSSVMSALSNHYGVQFKLDDQTVNLANCSIRTRFSNETINQVLEELASHMNFNYAIANQEVTISNLTCQ